jgi:spore coat polysaccharide biosynthesis protein SpsF
MRTAIFITVRMKSSRLPQKALLFIEDKRLIDHLIDRLKLAKLADLIVICTSTNPQDDILEQAAKENGVECFRGSEKDVLLRFYEAAKKFNIDFISVTWGDEIFCEPVYIDRMIEIFEKTGADLIKCQELPEGTETIGVKISALKKVCDMKNEEDTEVWGGYFEKGGFDIRYMEVADKEVKNFKARLTIDYPEDFQLAKEIFKRLYKKGEVFLLKEIIGLLKAEPVLLEINKECQKKYEENLKKGPAVKFKGE